VRVSRLRHKTKLYGLTTSVDDVGGHVETWALLATFRSQIDQRFRPSESFVFYGNQRRAVVYFEIRTHWISTTVHETMRLVCPDYDGNGAVFDILAQHDPDGRGVEKMFLCERLDESLDDFDD
jgi:hypothetical protein